ncbi:MAG: hypothetical protein V7L20_24270 [Nostoc sp.]|uniref:hypothetical protein n=1 Tax=Nostoc sp. TaxID=1180 RepID=UPI002FF80C35
MKAEVATAKAEVATAKAEVVTDCAKHPNVKAEVATACAKHSNVKAEVATAKADWKWLATMLVKLKTASKYMVLDTVLNYPVYLHQTKGLLQHWLNEITLNSLNLAMI